MISEQRNSVLGLTGLFVKVPSFYRLGVNLAVFSFVVGFLIKGLEGGFSSDALIFGGATGLFLLALPALLASVLAASVLSQGAFKPSLKHFLFLSLACSILAGLLYLTGVFAASFGLSTASFVLVANALVFLTWFVSAFLFLNYNLSKSFAVSLIQPFFSLSFLFFSSRLGLLESSLSIASPILALPKLAVSAFILLLALAAIFFIINAPAKKNFGVSTVQAIALFSSQWLRGSKEIERVFSEMGEEVETFATAFFFKKGRKLKAAFLLPLVHYGPFGNVGGSEFPFLLSKEMESKLGAPVVVFHGAVNHDFNPVYSHSYKDFAKAFASIKPKSFGNSSARFLEYNKKQSSASSAFGFSSGSLAFVSISRAPLPTDDVDFASGLALRNKLPFDEVMLIDRHNSFSEDYSMRPGGSDYFDYERAVSSLSKGKEGKLSLGLGKSTVSFTKEQGIGEAGIKAVVLEIAGKRACFVVFDSNNSLTTFRNALVKKFSPSFDFIDLFTTDTHSVNNIGGVFNPLGLNSTAEKLLQAAGEAISLALKDLEPVEVYGGSKKVKVRVLGASRQNELVSTINSIVSITKILAPLILFASVILALILAVY